MAIKIAKNLPNIKITVFDNPSVCSMAEDNIRENGLEARISALPGDIFTTPLPSGIDAVLLSHMLTIWSPENNIRILRKIYDHLPKHGDVVVFNMMGYEDESGPMITALGSPYFLAIATGEGMLYSCKEIETMVKEAGFIKQTLESLPKDHFVIRGTK